MSNAIVSQQQAVIVGYNPINGSCEAIGYLPSKQVFDQMMQLRPGVFWLEKQISPMDADHFGQIFPSGKIVSRGAIIGTYKDIPIAEDYLCEDGTRYDYEGIANDWSAVNALDYGMRILAPGILYKKRA
jgi:hypothetical protein